MLDTILDAKVRAVSKTASFSSSFYIQCGEKDKYLSNGGNFSEEK